MTIALLILLSADAIQSSITLPQGSNVFGFYVSVKSSGYGGMNTVNFTTTNRTITFTNGAGYLPGLATVTVQERLRGGRAGETRTLGVWIESSEPLPEIGSTIPYGGPKKLNRQSGGARSEPMQIPMPPMPGGLEFTGPTMPLPEAQPRGTNEVMRAMRKFYSGQIRARVE